MSANQIKKSPVKDLLYSFVAYALPTAALQFVIMPLIAKRLLPEANGLFLTLFNIVRLCVSLFVIPLSSIRLLKKKDCVSDSQVEKGFNFVLLVAVGLSAVIVLLLGAFYYGSGVSAGALLRLLIVLLLISAHDYFIVAFRIDFAFRSILLDNVVIVLGYMLGLVLMLKFGYWELVFISGYSFGLMYTLLKTDMWRKGVALTLDKKTLAEYGQLGASSGLNHATTYCDKMLIYPLIGGYNVSVYNAAAVVSKMMALVSVPLRNVFLSYIVDTDKVSVPKKKRLMMLAVLGGTVVLYGGFYVASILFCRILYPQFFEVALRYIPVILLAILFETYAGLLKVYLLRFEKTVLQTVMSFIKLTLYLGGVFVLNGICAFELMGFCFAILIADSVHFLIVLVCFLRSLKNKMGEEKHVS